MDIFEKDAASKKKCSECMYYKNNTYCIRKKQETENKDYCLHYVSVSDQHSVVGIPDVAEILFLGNIERGSS